ncbi:MAG: hypothetical protein ACI9N9_000057 [Enterobacterales bacterium]|jgi:hypothetical protein
MKNEIQKLNTGLAISNKEDFVAKFDPVQMNKQLIGLRTMNDAIITDFNSMAVYRKEFGEDTLLAVIEAHLLSLNISLNTHAKLDEHQVAEIAIEITRIYFHISIVEVHFVFRNAKRGIYGKIDYAINMPDVLLWFEKYEKERMRHFMTKQIDDQAQHKGYSERSEHIMEKERHDKMVNERKNDEL